MTTPACTCPPFELIVEVPLCGHAGPPPFPGGIGYRCTRTAGHGGAHVAWLGGQLLDTWTE